MIKVTLPCFSYFKSLSGLHNSKLTCLRIFQLLSSGINFLFFLIHWLAELLVNGINHTPISINTMCLKNSCFAIYNQPYVGLSLYELLLTYFNLTTIPISVASLVSYSSVLFYMKFMQRVFFLGSHLWFRSAKPMKNRSHSLQAFPSFT